MKPRRTVLSDSLILIALGLAAFVAAALMAWFVAERIPHLEDEIAYIFQARVFARGALWAPTPDLYAAYFFPFGVLVNGHWISKYTIGWPLLLALGERFGVGWLVNPVIGGLTVALVYLLGRDLYDRQIGIMAGILTLASPLFLIQSGVFMSHASACLWATLLTWGWLRVNRARKAGQRGKGWAIMSGASLGMLALTRPLTAVGVAIPFGVAMIVQAVRRRSLREVFTAYWPLVVTAAVVTALQPLYLYVVTGNPTTNLYTLVWSYDRIGFGPGFGVSGHTLHQALITTEQQIVLWTSDLFGWPWVSWVPVVAGLIFAGREAKANEKGWPLLLAGPFVGLVVVYMAYWIGAQLYGPRYYYEGMAGLAILAAVGLRSIVRLTGRGVNRLRKQEPGDAKSGAGWPVMVVLAGLLMVNGALYLPGRIVDWYGLYGITRAPIDQLNAVRQSDNVLVLVRGDQWVDYAPLISLNSPWLDGPIVAGHDYNPSLAAQIQQENPDREVWYFNAGILSKSPSPYPDQ